MDFKTLLMTAAVVVAVLFFLNRLAPKVPGLSAVAAAVKA